ncbi:glucose/ribitol dehydrogenase [Tanacetum coccineum]
MMGVNFMALQYLLKAVAERMRDNKTRGSIVFMTSIVDAERGIYPGAGAYGATLGGHQLVRAFENIEEMKRKTRQDVDEELVAPMVDKAVDMTKG